MNNILSNKYLITLFRVLFALIFIIAGIDKIADPEGFAVTISNYRLLPVPIINLFAIVLPWIEVVAALLLLFGDMLEENIIILNGLLIVFTFMVIIAVIRGLDIHCGCFGTKFGQKVGILKILENLFTITIGFYVLKFSNNSINFFRLK